MVDCINALKQWTGKAIATTVFASTVEPFTHDGLCTKVMWKPNNAIIGLTTDGDVFGGFYSVAVIEQDTDFHDLDTFIFESRGRCETPKRFSVKEWLEKIALVGSGRTTAKGLSSSGCMVFVRSSSGTRGQSRTAPDMSGHLKDSRAQR